jgi:hypothetical protein
MPIHITYAIGGNKVFKRPFLLTNNLSLSWPIVNRYP